MPTTVPHCSNITGIYFFSCHWCLSLSLPPSLPFSLSLSLSLSLPLSLSLSLRYSRLTSHPRTNKSVGDRSFAATAPRLWNSLPDHIPAAVTTGQFKRLLKCHLFNQLNYFMHANLIVLCCKVFVLFVCALHPWEKAHYKCLFIIIIYLVRFEAWWIFKERAFYRLLFCLFESESSAT